MHKRNKESDRITNFTYNRFCTTLERTYLKNDILQNPPQNYKISMQKRELLKKVNKNM
jgi:hypothetical protein